MPGRMPPLPAGTVERPGFGSPLRAALRTRMCFSIISITCVIYCYSHNETGRRRKPLYYQYLQITV